MTAKTTQSTPTHPTPEQVLPLPHANTHKRSAVILAAGPITKQPHSVHYRIVLLQWENSYSTHMECFMGVEEGAFLHSYFSEGHYEKLTYEGFKAATMDFGKRIAEDAQRHYDSLLRVVTIEQELTQGTNHV